MLQVVAWAAVVIGIAFAKGDMQMVQSMIACTVLTLVVLLVVYEKWDRKR